MLLGKIATIIAGILIIHQLLMEWSRRRMTKTPSVELPGSSLEPRRVASGCKTTRKGWLRVRVQSIRDESPDCRSFRLEPIDDERLPPFRGGQSIMVSQYLPTSSQPICRCYSLSGGPGESAYRITVKRVPGGRLSNQLHDQVRVGDQLEIQPPRGTFHIDSNLAHEPLVLIAAGIGITPMLSMLLENLEQMTTREVHLFYQLRDPSHAPFLRLLRGLVLQVRGTLPVNLHVFFSRLTGPLPVRGDSRGRVNAKKILCAVGGKAGEFMICGPDQFMSSIADGLAAGGVPPDRIHYESFGGKRRGKKARRVGEITVEANTETTEPVSAGSFSVQFQQGAAPVTWDGSHANLLELAEAHDVEIESACRAGHCGACVCQLRRGTVKYDEQPEWEADADEVVMCCARPTSDLEIAVDNKACV